MNAEKLRALEIQPEAKARSQVSIWLIFLGVALVSVAVGYFAWPKRNDELHMVSGKIKKAASTAVAATAASSTTSAPATPASVPVSGSILTVSGYIVNRERIEISPRFLGQVKWIGVRKGDAVTNGQVLVLLDDAEQQARVRESEGRLANAKASLEKAEIDFSRVTKLIANKIE